MIDPAWFTTGLATLFSVAASAVGVYIVLLVFTRLSGLRSFSKMSSFDFAMTVAVGSILATTMLSRTPALGTGATALAVLFGIQYVLAKSRRLSPMAQRLIDNEPLVLMAGDRMLPANLDRARVTVGDIHAKLRMAGIRDRGQVLAVILETTGDVAVIERGETLDSTLFADVHDAHRIPGIGPDT